jgi:stage II sporulation protein P
MRAVMNGKRVRKRGFRSFTFHIGTKKARTAIVTMGLALSVMFILLGTIAVQLLIPNHQNSLAGRVLHSVSSRSLISVFHHEIPLYASADPNMLEQSKNQHANFKSLFVYLITNIDIENPITMLGEQIPALAVTKFEPLSKDFQEPPGEDHLPPRPPDQTEPPATQPEQPVETDGKPVVYIYHTHNRESFLPELRGVTDPDQAYDKEKNITSVGERLLQSLKAKHIYAIQTKNDYWFKGDVANEYDLSRKTVQEVLKKYDSIKMVFDIHRDSLPRDKTTVKINGQDVARVYFIIGGSNKNKEKNEEFALKLHNKLNQMYPGVSKGAHVAIPNPAFDTRYNQDLFSNSVLIEIGGPENTLEEEYRAADILAEVIATVAKDEQIGGK